MKISNAICHKIKETLMSKDLHECYSKCLTIIDKTVGE